MTLLMTLNHKSPVGLALAGLLVVMMVTGCGFKLRGSLVAGKNLPPIYVDTERSSNLGFEVNQTLTKAGIQLVTQRDEAEWLVMLSDETLDRRVLSVDRSGKAQEYELHYSLYYQVTDRLGRVLRDKQSLTLLRDFSFSGVDVLAKADEEELLYRGMRRQAAQIMLRSLLVIKPNDVSGASQLEAQ